MTRFSFHYRSVKTHLFTAGFSDQARTFKFVLHFVCQVDNNRSVLNWTFVDSVLNGLQEDYTNVLAQVSSQNKEFFECVARVWMTITRTLTVRFNVIEPECFSFQQWVKKKCRAGGPVMQLNGNFRGLSVHFMRLGGLSRGPPGFNHCIPVYFITDTSTFLPYIHICMPAASLVWPVNRWSKHNQSDLSHVHCREKERSGTLIILIM